MTREQIIAGVVAVVVLLWPKLVEWAGRLKARVPGRMPAPEAEVTFEAAIHNLAAVRSRLLASALLDESAKKAIDTLTLQLVAGSDK